MRNYKKERENYHSRPEQMIRNAARKRARRQMEKAGIAKRFDGKDIHHKDNNPENNDLNNLSLVTQHYNRKEPRLREKKLKSLQAKLSQALTQKEGVDSDAMIDLMQKYLNTKNKAEKKTLLKQINRYQKKLGLKVTEDVYSDAKAFAVVVNKYMNSKNTGEKAKLKKQMQQLQKKLGLKVKEDMGSTTGAHIAGTGDDNTVHTRRKKKKITPARRNDLSGRIELIKGMAKKWQKKSK